MVLIILNKLYKPTPISCKVKGSYILNASLGKGKMDTLIAKSLKRSWNFKKLALL